MLPVGPPEDDELELRDYLVVLRRRWKTVVATVVATVVVALAVSFVQTPVYEASATLLLQSRASEQIFAPEAETAARAGDSDVLTEIGVMESRSVRQAVAEALGEPVEVSIEPEGETDLVTISAESTDAAEAAHIANTYAEVYISTRRQQLVADLQTAIDQVQAKITELENQMSTEVGQAQRTSIEALQEPYVEQIGKLQLAANLVQTGGAQIVGEAVAPTSPIRPTPLRNGVLALVVGAILGVGLAFLREHLDDSVKTKDDLQHAAHGVSVLGLIPTVEGWKDKASSVVVSLSHPESAAAEAYRGLRTSVQFLGLDRPLKVIQFTSPNASEGKTTTLANLAVALARAGQRVVVVCCDLRRPRVHEFLGLRSDPGFTSVLLGEMELSEALQAVQSEGRCSLLAAGPSPPNPSELLSSHRAEELFTMLRKECDVVLIDTPPVLPVTDALVVSRLVDATIVVATAGRTTRKEMHRAIELLHQVSAPVVGTVLNGVDQGAVYGSGNRYSTYDRKVAPDFIEDDDRASGGGHHTVVNGSNGATPREPAPAPRRGRRGARFRS